MSRFDTDITERLEWDQRYTRGHVPLTLHDAKIEIEKLRTWAKDEQQKREKVEEDRLKERERNTRLLGLLTECQAFLFDDSGTPLAPEDLRERVNDAIGNGA